jgi:YjbR
VPEYSDVPAEVMAELRAACLGLPDAYEQQAWAGARWCVRRRTFAHVLTVDSARGSATVLTFRSSGPELDALRRMGHPFFTPGWGTNVMGMVLDADTSWDEVAELLTESYCIMAPKKLVALVDRPPGEGDGEGDDD